MARCKWIIAVSAYTPRFFVEQEVLVCDIMLAILRDVSLEGSLVKELAQIEF